MTTPTLPTDPMEIPDYRLFCAAKHIADRVYERIANSGGSTDAGAPTRSRWMQDWRHTEPNPYFAQTSSGLMLELYYGTPNTLHTPWGKWNFGGSSSSRGAGFDAEARPLHIDRRGVDHAVAQAVGGARLGFAIDLQVLLDQDAVEEIAREAGKQPIQWPAFAAGQ